jgi:hypothetical protein
MKDGVTLMATFLLMIVFFVIHWADDIVRGFAPGGMTSLSGLLILTTLLYGGLVLSERRAGLIIVLIGGLGGVAVLALHMSGPGIVGGRIANSDGRLFWVFTLLANGATGAFSAVLAAQGLWRLQRGARPG